MRTRQQIESIARSRKKLRLTLIFVGILAVLVAAAITIGLIFKGDDSGAGNGGTGTPPTPIGDEALYRGSLVAYPYIDDAKITRITVSNNNKEGGEYTFIRNSMADGNFLFTYMEDGELKIYYPSICQEDPYFEYEDLYAVENTDGFGKISKITYLLAALEASYFGERIPLSTDKAEREAQYKQFGLNGDNATVLAFDYEDEIGDTHTHKLVIGDRTVSGSGYYFTVDDRDYVYNSLSAYFEYALLGFYSYVNSALVSAGLEGDSTLEPIYTPEFTQWKTELYDKVGDVVPDKAEVVISASLKTPLVPSDYINDPDAYYDSLDGYITQGFADMTVMLSDTTIQEIKNALIGKEVGVYYNPDDAAADKSAAISLTVINDYEASRKIALADALSRKYTYEILAVEAIVKDGGDITAPGTPVGENDIIKVTYRVTVDGKQTADIPLHAIIDLTSPALSEAAPALRALSVGVLSEGEVVRFDVNYTRDNATEAKYQSKITEIITITNKDGKRIDKVAEDSVVIYRYQMIVNGELVDEEFTGSIDMAKAESETDLALKEQLMGRKISRYLSIIVDEEPDYYEVFNDFTSYEIASIKYFVTKTEVVSFSFLSNSERDPFYGDSIYKNETDGYLVYGVDDFVCDHILKLIGGIGENTSQSMGLQGMETVSVGITPEKLYKLGLYEHILYFELPRGLVAVDSGDENTIDDYTYYDKLGFTLYVSDILDDGTRYVASDIYDVITKASNDAFFFLEETFVDFWARNSLIMTDVAYMQNIKIEFNFEDYYGSYDLDIDKKKSYITENGLQIGGKEPSSYHDKFDYLVVDVTPGDNCTPNKLTEYIKENGRNYMSLTELYDMTYPDPDDKHQYFPDSLGTTYFKEFILSMFYVEYEGAVDENEQNDALENYPMLMKFSLKIDTDRDGDDTDEGYYVYEFYRHSDRRVLVKLYKILPDGTPSLDKPVSDFYISTYALRKIVTNFDSILNAELFEIESGYEK